MHHPVPKGNDFDDCDQPKQLLTLLSPITREILFLGLLAESPRDRATGNAASVSFRRIHNSCLPTETQRT